MPFDARLPSRQQTPSRSAVPARSSRSRARLPPDGRVPRSAIPVIEQWR